jgi:SAM-dependent methyltransferase
LKDIGGLRNTFDEVVEFYDEVRPGYPLETIEDVISISNIPQNGRILEIGCGTGQATIPYANRGYFIHCLEIGKNMVSIALKKFQTYPNVTIENIAFEDWPLQKNAYDMVLSATAFHWIPSKIGFPKAAKVLRESGYLALMSNIHPAPYTGFFERVQLIYKEVVPEWEDPRNGPSTEDRIKLEEKYINSTGLFEKVLVKQYGWSAKFTAEQYLKLLNTFSDHRNLEDNKRTQLFKKINNLINEEYGGIVTRPYLTILYIAKKSARSQ